jgi:hypothetical protein
MSGEKNKKKKGSWLLKLLMFLLILVLITGVALYAFLDINPLIALEEGFAGLYSRVFTVSATELSENIKLIDAYDLNENPAFAAVEDDLLVCTISALRQFDSEGREKAYIPVGLKKPLIQVHKKSILVADIGGRSFSLISDGRVLWERSIDEDIVNASLSDGFILVITKSNQSGYKRTIRSYSLNGDMVSLRNVSNYYPFSAHHYPEFDKSVFLVSGVEASGLTTNGLFEFLDASMNQKASIRGEEEILLGGLPMMKQRLLLYGEHSVILVNQAISTLWEKDYTAAKVTAVGIVQEKYPVVATLDADLLSRERREETTVSVLNEDGSERGNLVIDAGVTGISCKGKTAAVLAGPEVYFINAAGEVLDVYTAKTDVTGVYMAREDLAYVVAGGEVVRVKIKGLDKFLGIF